MFQQEQQNEAILSCSCKVKQYGFHEINLLFIFQQCNFHVLVPGIPKNLNTAVFPEDLLST